MSQLSPEQRNYSDLLEAERVGIYKSILPALYASYRIPILAHIGASIILSFGATARQHII